jgi:hypothetical protein
MLLIHFIGMIRGDWTLLNCKAANPATTNMERDSHENCIIHNEFFGDGSGC